MLQEFKTFILRGSLVDLAVGFTVGAAFTSVARSLVDDVIMPPIGLLTGNVDFAEKMWVLKQGTPPGPYETTEIASAAGAIAINYGRFFNACLSLLLVAFAMFIIIKLVNRIDRQLEDVFYDTPEPGEPTDKKCPRCRMTIPYRATRCPNCTSELQPVDSASRVQADLGPES